jgi:sugar O-acyltransferase (sialic acid O-acetyltransferase NeuD family)
MKKVILFGTKQTAELANYYLEEDSDLEVVAFSVHGENIESDVFCGKPVLPFEDLPELRSPDDFLLFAPMMAGNVNGRRLQIFKKGQEYGYKFASYISSKATILTKNIGVNCFILENNTIQPFVKIGNNCVLWSGNHIGHHSEVGSSTFITSQCVISGNSVLKERCYLGVNSTLTDQCILEKGVMITMGSVLTIKKTEAWGVYSGNPARKHPKLTSDRLLK